MQTFYISPPAYTEWKAQGIDYESLLNYIYTQSINRAYTLQERDFFLFQIKKELKKFSSFLSDMLGQIWHRVEYCENLVQILLHLDHEGKEIAIGEAGEINVIATGQILELIKFNQENFTALCKLVLKHNEFTGMGITSEVAELLNQFPITQHTLEQKKIVRRLVRIYNEIQGKNSSSVPDSSATGSKSDCFETTLTGWIDPDRANDFISEIKKNMEYCLDENINEHNYWAEKQGIFDHEINTPLPEPLHKDSSHSEPDESTSLLSSKLKNTHLTFDCNHPSCTNQSPVAYNTVYFDSNLSAYHDMVSGLKKTENIKIRWRSSTHTSALQLEQVANNASTSNNAGTTKLRSNASDAAALSCAHSDLISLDSISCIELENHQEMWSGDPSILERVYIPKNSVGAYLASEYHIEKRRRKLEGSGWLSSNTSHQYALFQKIQRKIILEKQKPVLRTHGFYHYFKDKSAESQAFIEIITNLKIIREDNMDGVDRSEYNWFKKDLNDLNTKNSGHSSQDSKKFAPAIIKINLRNKVWPSWLYDLVFYQENVYWVNGFDPYIYGVSMLMESHTHLLPYWCFEVSHPSLTRDFGVQSSSSSCKSLASAPENENILGEFNESAFEYKDTLVSHAIGMLLNRTGYSPATKSHSISTSFLRNKTRSSLELPTNLNLAFNAKALKKAKNSDTIYAGDRPLNKSHRVSSFPMFSASSHSTYGSTLYFRSQGSPNLSGYTTKHSPLLEYGTHGHSSGATQPPISKRSRNRKYLLFVTVIIIASITTTCIFFAETILKLLKELGFGL